MDRDLATDLPRIVSASDIAARLGVLPSAVSNWQNRYPNFPTPIAASGRVRLWEWETVEQWCNQTGHPRDHKPTLPTPIGPRLLPYTTTTTNLSPPRLR